MGGPGGSAHTGGASRLEGVLVGSGAEGGGVELAQELRKVLLVGDGHEGQAELNAGQLLRDNLIVLMLKQMEHVIFDIHY